MAHKPKKCLLEIDVGITEYIGNNKGFNGTLKHRFSDFHVNEVRLDGSVVRLTDESVPEEAESSNVDYKIDAVSPEILLQLVELSMHGGQEVMVDVTNKSKDERRDIHDLIRKKFHSKLISNTKEKDGKKLLIVSKSNKSGADKRPSWPASRKGDYVHFVMYKENKDTMEVVNLLAHKLKMKPNYITYAGTKDRRAKTSQMLCARKVEPSRLAAINKYLNGINLGNYVFKANHLKLGDLKGNHFRIAVRNVGGTEEDVARALNTLKSDGFINYYGLQRFGSTFEVPTYNIGLSLLLGDWAKAVDLILSPRENEVRADVRAARETWHETRNAEEAYGKLWKGQNTVEGKLLQGLVKNGSDMMGALNFLPRNMRLLYLHSYQSIIWNKVASRRIKEFGLKPVAGDLVFNKPEGGPSLEHGREHDVGKAPAVDLDNISDECVSEAAELCNDNVCSELEVISADEEERAMVNQHGSKSSVSILTAELAETTSIEDVVLPLPGYDVAYPSNAVGTWYEELLAADGLTSATMKRKAKSYSLAGTYRHLVKRVENLSWKMVRYSSQDDTLILSDVEKLRLVEPLEDDPAGNLKGLIMEFTLPSSSYATMALRQVMKQDTSSGFQTNLSRAETEELGKQSDKREGDYQQSSSKKVKLEDTV